MTANFKGVVVQAGTDGNGQPRTLIHTTAEELRAMSAIPFFTEAEILIRWKDTSPEEEAAKALPEVMP